MVMFIHKYSVVNDSIKSITKMSINVYINNISGIIL